MKKEQNQNGKQDQPIKHPPQQPQGNGKEDESAEGSNKSNISVDNEGRIGKAHERWPADDKQQNKDAHRDDQRIKSDKTNTTPEIDAPIYDPEKTEKKIPKM